MRNASLLRTLRTETNFKLGPDAAVIDLSATMTQLARRRPVFHSEADFQHAFAWLLHESHPDAQLRLEVPIATQAGTIHTDVVVRMGARIFALELKYKTREIAVEVAGESFSLRSHVALPLGRYDVLKDVQRVESIIELAHVHSGAVVFLTNDSAYWSAARSNDDTSAAFSLVEGRTITGTLDWSVRTSSGTKKNREQPITIRGEYLLHWQQYSTVPSRAYSSFRWLMFKCEP